MFKKPAHRHPVTWVPSLYYAQGIPYVVVMLVSVIMYKRMGISNADIAFYTSLLYLPWVLKPLWSPVVDIFKTKRVWIVVMQFIVGLGLAGVAFTIPVTGFLQYTLAFFFLLAFSSATHDIAADGFYMLGLSKGDQAYYVGFRSLFYRLSMITGQGLVIILAGYFEIHSGLPTQDLVVNVKPGISEELVISPDFIREETAEQKILPVRKEVQMSVEKRSKYEVDSVLFLVRKLNAENNLYGDESAVILNEKFNSSVENRQKTAGNISVISFYVTGSPDKDKEVIVNIDRSGDKNLALIEGSRFVFNERNWSKPAYSVIQIDPKLREESSAVFTPLAGDIPWAWSTTFLLLTGLFVIFFLYHFFILPYPAADSSVIQLKEGNQRSVLKEFGETFKLFFSKPKIILIITFLLIYRFGEAQLVKLASPFLLDPREVGGIGLTTSEVGIAYGTVGIIALSIGGILGGILASRDGLKKWLWWMFASINIPHILYIYLAYVQPDSFIIINLCVAGEQFGYGFGFTAYMLYMIYISEGEYKTSHYAIATGFMALSMMIPGLFAGLIQEAIGYKLFFVWILITMIPGFFVTKMIPLDALFGKKTKEAE